MSYAKTDPRTQENAMNGDEIAILEIMSHDPPSLYAAIRARCERVANEAADLDVLDEAALARSVDAPDWYPHSKRDIGIAMRSLNYYKDGGRWIYGKRPKRLKKRRGLYVTKSILKNEARRSIIRIIEMCEADLARRDRMRDG